MENGIENAFSEAHERTEPESKKNRSRGFKQKCTDKNIFCQGHNAAQMDIACGLHEKLSFVQIHLFFFGEKRKQRHQGHESEPSDLYQKQDHDLTEKTPMCIYVK